MRGKLGFDAIEVDTTRTYTGPHKPNLNYRQEYLLLYSDVIQPRPFNNDLCTLVDCYPFCLSERTNLVSSNPYFQNIAQHRYGDFRLNHLVSKASISEIQFKLLHENELPVIFDVNAGSRLLTFCFKRNYCFV